MSQKIRSFVVALVACGFASLLVLPRSTAQEKSGEQKSVDLKSADQAKKDAPVTKAAEQGVGTKDDSATKSNKADNSLKSPNSAKPSKSPTASGNTLRLPRYFSGIVDQEQRKAIYAIQLEYRSKIAELEEELGRVRQDELLALEKLLTDSQRKLLAKKRAQTQESSKAKSTNEASAKSDSTDSAME